jgi:dTDP-4-dehydrorhamnose reductase
MDDRPIWVTGAAGLIGRQIMAGAAQGAPGVRTLGLTRAHLDLEDFAAVRTESRRHRPRLIIHCAALSQSPDCQANPPLARKLNVEVTALLAELAADIPFVFFSSDLVFDGRAGNYDEATPLNPISVYGETKAMAERAVLLNPRHTVIRTSLNAGISLSGTRAFNEQMRRAWEAGQPVRLFTDEFRSPIAAQTTARAVWELAAGNKTGIYHVAGSERLSRLQIGQLLAARWPGLHPSIIPGSLREYTGVPRAPDTSLNCAKAQQCLSFPLPGFTRWLAEHPEERL